MSALGGYATRTYEYLEDLAEATAFHGRARYIGSDYETALNDYLRALHALAAERGNVAPGQTRWRQTGKDDLQARARAREARSKQPIKRRRGLGRAA